MRKLITATLAITALVGCSTTNSFSEPSRSYYYSSCLEAGLMVTTCQCMEDTAIKKTGVSNVDHATNAEKEPLLDALRSAISACQKKTLSAIEASK